MKILDELWTKWTPEPNTGCYIWTGYVAGSNSPRPCIWRGSRSNKKAKYVARMVCEEAYGLPPTSKHQAAHKPPCSNILCINPDHLYWATQSQNMMDKSREERERISAFGLASVDRGSDGRFAAN